MQHAYNRIMQVTYVRMQPAYECTQPAYEHVRWYASCTLKSHCSMHASVVEPQLYIIKWQFTKKSL